MFTGLTIARAWAGAAGRAPTPTAWASWASAGLRAAQATWTRSRSPGHRHELGVVTLCAIRILSPDWLQPFGLTFDLLACGDALRQKRWPVRAARGKVGASRPVSLSEVAHWGSPDSQSSRKQRKWATG